MKTSDLKKLIKSIVKECLFEILSEDFDLDSNKEAPAAALKENKIPKPKQTNIPKPPKKDKYDKYGPLAKTDPTDRGINIDPLFEKIGPNMKKYL